MKISCSYYYVNIEVDRQQSSFSILELLCSNYVTRSWLAVPGQASPYVALPGTTHPTIRFKTIEYLFQPDKKRSTFRTDRHDHHGALDWLGRLHPLQTPERGRRDPHLRNITNKRGSVGGRKPLEQIVFFHGTRRSAESVAFVVFQQSIRSSNPAKIWPGTLFMRCYHMVRH